MWAWDELKLSGWFSQWYIGLFKALHLYQATVFFKSLSLLIIIRWFSVKTIDASASAPRTRWHPTRLPNDIGRTLTGVSLGTGVRYSGHGAVGVCVCSCSSAGASVLYAYGCRRRGVGPRLAGGCPLSPTTSDCLGSQAPDGLVSENKAPDYKE